MIKLYFIMLNGKRIKVYVLFPSDKFETKTDLYKTQYEIIKIQRSRYDDVTNDIILHKKKLRYGIRYG